MEIKIDLSNIDNKKAAIGRFTLALGIDSNKGESWDAFYDDIRSLHTQSSVVIEKQPKKIHLILENIKKLEEVDKQTYSNLIEILASATDKNERYDNIDFTFELRG